MLINIPWGWEFPGGPVARTWHSHHGGLGSTPGWGTKIPQAAQCGVPQTLKRSLLSYLPPAPRLQEACLLKE